MTEEIKNAAEARRWDTRNLSGFGATLETLMELQAILHEIVGYHSSFEELNELFTGRLELPVDKTRFLARQVQRLVELRDATRQEFVNLGDELIWCGLAVDDLEEFSKEHSSELSGYKARGFDRGNMIKFGKKVITLLRLSKSVMASVHLITVDLREPFVEITGLFSESEEAVYGYLDSLTYLAFHDIDRVRDLSRDYTNEIAILEQQENNKAEAAAE